MAEEDKKVVSDEDWKKEAQKAKEKLTDAAQTKAAGGRAAAAQSGPIPEASFTTLVNSLVVQILYSLGRLADPNDTSKRPPVNLELAKHHIDVLGVLEEKTKGNLTEDEKKSLAIALHEMRMQYVAAAHV
jgi:hypothetical protein